MYSIAHRTKRFGMIVAMLAATCALVTGCLDVALMAAGAAIRQDQNNKLIQQQREIDAQRAQRDYATQREIQELRQQLQNERASRTTTAATPNYQPQPPVSSYVSSPQSPTSPTLAGMRAMAPVGGAGTIYADTNRGSHAPSMSSIPKSLFSAELSCDRKRQPGADTATFDGISITLLDTDDDPPSVDLQLTYSGGSYEIKDLGLDEMLTLPGSDGKFYEAEIVNVADDEESAEILFLLASPTPNNT